TFLRDLERENVWLAELCRVEYADPWDGTVSPYFPDGVHHIVICTKQAGGDWQGQLSLLATACEAGAQQEYFCEPVCQVLPQLSEYLNQPSP
ncbi:MAG: hypothetical protein KC561_11555, partial [Myxococcales bacterium]|nr:hypothetical protein [Myxococcales bacterium]